MLFVSFGEFGVGVRPSGALPLHVVSPVGERDVGVDELLVLVLERLVRETTLFESLDGFVVGFLEGGELGSEGGDVFGVVVGGGGCGC